MDELVMVTMTQNEEKEALIRRLSEGHGFPPWHIRIMDMQRSSIKLPNPPSWMLSPLARQKYSSTTLMLQANGFTFTTSQSFSPHPSSDLIETPYRVQPESLNGTVNLDLHYHDVHVNDFESLKLLDIVTGTSAYYFPFRIHNSKKLNPVYLIFNPFKNCAYRCKFCSRIPFFNGNESAISRNIQCALEDLSLAVNSPEDVRFVNIITGSLPKASDDIRMIRKTIHAFREAGFHACDFGVYSSNFRTRAHMNRLRELGVIFLTVTAETTTPEAAERLYSSNNPKRRYAFDLILESVKIACDTFPFVNMTLILGFDKMDRLKVNLERIARNTSATVNYYIPRIWQQRQYELLHPTARKLNYYVEMCAFIEKQVNRGKMTVGRFLNDRFNIPRKKLRYRT